MLGAVRLLDQAVARDPRFLMAFYQLAGAHDQIYFYGIDRSTTRLALADTAVQTALHLRPSSGEAHLASALHQYWGYLNYDRARAELQVAMRTLPNEPLVHVTAGYIDRRQGRWQESIRSMQRALELDPRNLSILQQLSFSYELLRDYANMAATLDRALAVAPKDASTRVHRALVNYKWYADPKPIHFVIQAVIAQDAAAAASVSNQWFDLALSERDVASAELALAALPPEGYSDESFTFPRAWCEGLIYRLRDDVTGSRTALSVLEPRSRRFCTNNRPMQRSSRFLA